MILVNTKERRQNNARVLSKLIRRFKKTIKREGNIGRNEKTIRPHERRVIKMLEAIMNIIFYIPKKILAHFKRVQELDAEIARLDIDLRKACLFILDMASKAIEGEENNPYMKCVPQFRERFILIGSRDAEDIFLPVPTHFQTHQNAMYRWRTLGETIKDLENDVEECSSFSEDRIKYLQMVPEGGNWRNLPEDVVQSAMGGAYKSGGGKVGFYRRLSYSQPSPTVVTSPVQKATMMCHPTQDRPLSVKEYARIQQFPDDWVFTGTTASKYRQIGNAVPVGLAEAIGEAVISVADDTATVKTKRFRGTSIHNKIKDALEMGGNSNGNK